MDSDLRDSSKSAANTAPPQGARLFEGRTIVRTRIDATTYDQASQRIIEWAEAGEGRAVFAANVHMVMEAYDDASFQHVVNSADMVTADGVPLVWALRLYGVKNATRVYGPDLTLAVCESAARQGVRVGFYGGSPDSLSEMIVQLRSRYPALCVAYQYSPPFRPLTSVEDAQVIAAIKNSGAEMLFVGLGCPKQERWIAARRADLQMPLLGVGAAFDFIARRKPQAPKIMQRLGLEWVFRLITEPRRLWRRYAVHNPRFVLLLAWNALVARRHR